MNKLSWVLGFSGSWLHRPWALTQLNGSKIDLFPFIHKTLLKMDGKSAKYQQDSKSCSLMLDDSTDVVVDYKADGVVWLKKMEGFGMSNIVVYLSEALTWLSGRRVEVDFSDKGFKITADSTEKVFGVKFLGRGNSCRIPEGAERSVCKIGTSDVCIFLVAGSDGFTCEKFSSGGRHMLHRHFDGTTRASRVGNCACVGREEDTTPKDPNTRVMSLDTKPGDKVLFDKPNQGYEWDVECTKKYLVVGNQYTVERIEVGDSSSEVYFREVPDVGFNTVHFQNVEELIST
jgi:hypothetical protein